MSTCPLASLECFEFSELWPRVRIAAHGDPDGESQFGSALGAAAVGWNWCAVQNVLEATRCGDLQFLVGVDLGEGQSCDESQHSKVCQAHPASSPRTAQLFRQVFIGFS